MPPALAKLLKEQGLLFVAILGGTVIGAIAGFKLPWQQSAPLIVGLVVITFGLSGFTTQRDARIRQN